VLRSLVRGDLLGEVALFRDAPHSATAIALERVTLIAIASDRRRTTRSRKAGGLSDGEAVACIRRSLILASLGMPMLMGIAMPVPSWEGKASEGR